MLLQSQTVQHTGAGKQCLVGRGPRRGNDDCVDDGWNGTDACCGRRNDKGALGCVSIGVVEALVVAGDEHADDEDGKHVEEDDADKDVAAGGGDCLARIPRLGAGHGDGLDAGKGEDGVGHDAPVAEELAPVPAGNVLDKGARVLPVFKVDGRGAGDATEVDDEAENDEEDDEEDLEQGKEELDLAKDADKGHADNDGEDDESDDPDGGVDVGPKLKEDADGGNLGGDREQVAVDEVPADGEPPGRVDEELGVPHKGTRDGEQGADLSEGKLHGADDEADGRVAQQRAEGTARLHGAAEAEEQARANGARDAQHGEVPLAQPALEAVVLGVGHQVRVCTATAAAATLAVVVVVVVGAAGRLEVRVVLLVVVRVDEAAAAALGGLRLGVQP